MTLPKADVLAALAPDLGRIASATHHDPHALLGVHQHGAAQLALVYVPRVRSLAIDGLEATRLPGSDFFALATRQKLAAHPWLSGLDARGEKFGQHDPYSFLPDIEAADLQRFAAGRDQDAWRWLGAQLISVDGIAGARFAVWAPNAARVSVVGPFCQWDGRRYPLRSLGASGVWALFIPGLRANEIYKFEIRHRDTGMVFLKTDPYARASELRPATASVVAPPRRHSWRDATWLTERSRREWLHAPMSIYEMHAGSWRRAPDGGFLTWRQLAALLIPYVCQLGYTHVELLPITEHPLDDSWGYQTTGYFAPTSRHGSADDLRFFIDECHLAGLGVLLDWVPAHFPRDAHALANFDGSKLYEYEDPRRAEHQDWGTLIFNYERHEVRSFLISSACYWLDEFHFDGLRVDAVASMIYLDFSRRKDAFVPNKLGGNTNLEAIDFLRELNRVVHARFAGAVVCAEESTDWPLVSRPTDAGGLGFSMKWNMGWMHDTLEYFSLDPVFRQHHHEKLTFSMMYAYSENFILPLSHDEIVHLKKSLLGKMPGDSWQRFANLRLLLAWMWTFPGKKLLFMGGEFAQDSEWDFRSELPWAQAANPANAGVSRLLQDLNRLYREDPRLHELEFEPEGFRWIDCNDRANSLLAFQRLKRGSDAADALIVALNFTPVPREAHRIGVPFLGNYREVLNSDSQIYGGSNLGNLAMVAARDEPAMGLPYSLNLILPPLAAVVLAPVRNGATNRT